MILAIDAGNTNIVLGCMEGMELRASARISTDPKKTEHEYAALFRDVLGFEHMDVASFEGAILSSVVTPLTPTLQQAVKLLIGKAPLVVGKGLKTGLDIRIDDPAQLGADLVVGAVAASQLYEPPIIMVDMGTATTVFVLDDRGRFVGGAIMPGIMVSMAALSQGTSQLPMISMDKPKKCIGTNTIHCMQSGAIYGNAAMLDGMVERFEEELGYPAAVVATGGTAGTVVPFCKRKIIYEPELLMKGLAILWEKNRRS